MVALLGRQSLRYHDQAVILATATGPKAEPARLDHCIDKESASAPVVACNSKAECTTGKRGTRMATRIAVIVIDCNDPAPVAAFWKAALGYAEAARDGD